MSASTAAPDTEARRRSTRRLLVLVAVVTVGVLLVANAHLIYVAFTSQPNCVAHSKGAGDAGSYRAAKSAC